MKITVESTHAIKGLKEISDNISDLTPLMKNIAGFLADVTEDAFQGEYDPTTGAGWAGLLPATIKARQKKAHWPGKILQDRGELASSIVTDFDSTSTQIGTNKVYASAHQFGVDSYPDRSGELEARPFIGFSPQDAEEIEQLIVDFLN